MKVMLGLCALLFAGHAAASTCSDATLKGNYLTRSRGTISNGGVDLRFVATGSGIVRGDGTAKVHLTYSVAGVSQSTVQEVPYSVENEPDGSGNCLVYITPVLSGTAVTFVGHTGPKGKEMEVSSTLPGTSIEGFVKKSE